MKFLVGVTTSNLLMLNASIQPIMKTCTDRSDADNDMGGNLIRSLEVDIKIIYETVNFNKPLN